MIKPTIIYYALNDRIKEGTAYTIPGSAALFIPEYIMIHPNDLPYLQAELAKLSSPIELIPLRRIEEPNKDG